MAKSSGLTLEIQRTAVILSSLLFLSYAMHFGGRINFAFDLFSHFLNQYMIGGAILGIILLVLKKWKIGLLCLMVAGLCLAEGRANLQDPYLFEAPNGAHSLKVMSFNHLLFQTDYQSIETWIRHNGYDIDVIALLEAQRKGTMQLADSLKDIYPFQIHEARSGSTGIIILSKHPVSSTQKQRVPIVAQEWLGVISFTMHSEKLSKDIAFFVAHPPVPSNDMLWTARNSLMDMVARQVKRRSNNHVIVMGDFNNTPFTPSFRDFLEVSGLNYQSYGLLQTPTWPTFADMDVFQIFQIPIDHIFFSDSLMQKNKYRGPSLKSDHHPIIAEFSEL